MMRFTELSDIIRREVGEDMARRVCRAICRESAGEQVYIPRRAERPIPELSDTVSSLQKSHGVSRSTAYNWVSSWRK